MGFTPDPYVPLATAAKTARIIGGVMLALGILCLVLLVVGLADNPDPMMFIVLGSIVAGYAVPAVVLLASAKRLQQGQRGAILATLITAIITTCFFTLALILQVIGYGGRNPAAIVIAAVLLMLSAILVVQCVKAQQVASQLGANAPRGFAPILPPQGPPLRPGGPSTHG